MAALALPVMPSTPLQAPRKLWLVAIGLGAIGWICSAMRHGLLQSNAYDLGLFDQWVWLISQGVEPISSMEQVHVLADHGAWLLYPAGLSYRLLASVQWLLASQAMALSLTAIPLWGLAKQADLPERRCWWICMLWWLQPVVFNTTLFDFHPETWVMPAFAIALWAERNHRCRLWIGMVLLMLGSRDGLVLIIGGMALDLAWRRRWRWSGIAAGIALGWLLLLSRWLYPLLRDGEGPKAAGRMFSHLSANPLTSLENLHWGGGFTYLLLLLLPCAWLWRRRSLPTLLIGVPLLLVNLLSASPSYRTLIHHYSLPLAVVMVVAVIDGQRQRQRTIRMLPWSLGWAVACWLALAKPWAFTGPYLQRLAQLDELKSAIALVEPDDALLTTSYLVPQFSQRLEIGFPKRGADLELGRSKWTALLLNPMDPGWGSSPKKQGSLLNDAEGSNWTCQTWPSGLTLCRKPESA